MAKLPNQVRMMAVLAKLSQAAGVTLVSEGHPEEKLDGAKEPFQDEHITVDLDTCVEIYPAEIPTRTLAGTTFRPGYAVTTTEVLPGTRDFPPGEDITEEATSRNEIDIANIAIRLVVERRLLNALMALSEEEDEA